MKSLFDITHYEEAHTAWMRNARTFELVFPNAKHAYAVTQEDGEYGFLIHRDIAFTASDAFRIACKRAQWMNEYKDGSFILVNDDQLDYFTDMIYDYESPTYRSYSSTEMVLLWTSSDGTTEKLTLFGVRN